MYDTRETRNAPRAPTAGARRARMVAVGLGLAGLAAAFGVSFFGTDGKPTDLIANPNNYYSWPNAVITWKMSPDFLAAFPNPLQHEQVRLAFREWEIASASQARRDSPRYGWKRNNGQRNFFDLRTIMVHEIGHTLGSQHPDACWYNTDPDTGDPYHRNYTRVGNAWVAEAPNVEAVMNEGAWPEKGLKAGEYWRLTSKDELELLDYAYGFQIDFQEVFGNTPADLVVETFAGGGQQSQTLGVGGPDGSTLKVAGEPLEGRWITSASIAISDNASKPIGFEARPSSWEFNNYTGHPVSSLVVRTRGSDNPNPIQWSSQGPNKFNALTSSEASQAYQFEDRVWRYHLPSGGSVPPGATVKIGLRLDVWDWTVVSAGVTTVDGVIYPACLTTVFDWINLAPPAGGMPFDEGECLIDARPREVLNRGFRIVAPDSDVTLTIIEYAPADQAGLRLDELGSEMLRDLRASGALRTVTIPPRTLAPGEEFIVVLDGDPADLPRDMVIRGNYVVVNDPGVAEGGYFTHVPSACSPDGSISSFTWLDDDVYEPPCPGDADGDGAVTLTDVSIALSEFGASGPGLLADFDGSGTVDLADLSIVLANYGNVCS